MTEPVGRSRELMEMGWYCSESVLTAVAEARGFGGVEIPRIASGLGAGMARTNRTCGAVTGAVLAIGLLRGRDRPEESLDPCFNAVQEFLRHFEEAHGSTSCPALTNCDLSTDEGRQRFREQGLRTFCTDLVESATALVLKVAG